MIYYATCEALARNMASTETSAASNENTQQIINAGNIERMSNNIGNIVTDRSLPHIERSYYERCRRRWKFSDCFRCTSAMRDEEIPPSRGAPPTYSSIYTGPILQLDRRSSTFPINVQSSDMVLRIPPPTYDQAQGINSAASPNQFVSLFPNAPSIWPRVSTATMCPQCAAFIVTAVVIRRPTIIHLTALTLCLFGCWPCCMIPYCIDSCNIADHYCPLCRAYLGTST